MEPRSLIARLSRPNQRGARDCPLGILEAAGERTWTRTGLADEFDTSRNRLHKLFTPLVALDLVDEADYAPTGAGTYLLASFDAAFEVLEVEEVYYLANSENRSAILRSLVRSAAWKSELIADPQLPSKGTVQRTLRQLREFGWVCRNDGGAYEATGRGVEALETYDRLVLGMAQATEKTPFLNVFGDRCSEFAPASLAASDMVVVTPETPTATLDASIEAAGVYGSGVDRIRAVVTMFSPTLYDAFTPLFESDAHVEIVLGRTATRHLVKPQYRHYLACALDAPNVEIRLSPSDDRVSYGVFDDTALIGGPGSEEALLVTTDPSLVDWTHDVIDDAWETSENVSDYLEQNRQQRTRDDTPPSEAA